MLFPFTGLDEPNFFALAEVAYLFSASKMLNHINKNPVVLAKDRQAVLNKSRLPDGSVD